MNDQKGTGSKQVTDLSVYCSSQPGTYIPINDRHIQEIELIIYLLFFNASYNLKVGSILISPVIPYQLLKLFRKAPACMHAYVHAYVKSDL